jgi:hypothetical protein
MGTAVNTKSAVFWGVTPYCLAERFQCFGGDCQLHHQATVVKVKTASVSEMVTLFCQTVRRNIPETMVFVVSVAHGLVPQAY